MPEILLCSKRGGVSPLGYMRIDVTSHATDVFRTCSPFFAGPVSLYGNYVSKNVENAWQYSKVYSQFIGDDGNPTQAYFAWAQEGWSDSVAHRHPMGHIFPKYSWWDGTKLDYIEARKKIYIPLYTKAVIKTAGYQELKRLYEAGERICLLDYDSFDYQSMGYSINDVIEDKNHSLGHSFVLKCLLEGELPLPSPFRVIIAGGRDFNDYEILCKYADFCLQNKGKNIEIVCGKARGADTLGECYANERGFGVRYFPADWNRYGKSAGYIRNKQMGEFADALIAFWDGQSRGTKHMIEIMKSLKKPIRIYHYI